MVIRLIKDELDVIDRDIEIDNIAEQQEIELQKDDNRRLNKSESLHQKM